MLQGCKSAYGITKIAMYKHPLPAEMKVALYFTVRKQPYFETAKKKKKKTT